MFLITLIHSLVIQAERFDQRDQHNMVTRHSHIKYSITSYECALCMLHVLRMGSQFPIQYSTIILWFAHSMDVFHFCVKKKWHKVGDKFFFTHIALYYTAFNTLERAQILALPNRVLFRAHFAYIQTIIKLSFYSVTHNDMQRRTIKVYEKYEDENLSTQLATSNK